MKNVKSEMDEPEKSTVPSGVIPIAGSNLRVYCRDSTTILYLAFQ